MSELLGESSWTARAIGPLPPSPIGRQLSQHGIHKSRRGPFSRRSYQVHALVDRGTRRDTFEPSHLVNAEPQRVQHFSIEFGDWLRRCARDGTIEPRTPAQ